MYSGAESTSTTYLKWTSRQKNGISFPFGPETCLCVKAEKLDAVRSGQAAQGIWLFQKALHRVRPHPVVVDRYLRYYLEHLAKTGALARFSTGSTIKHIPQQRLREIPVIIPPLAEQHRITEALDDHLSRLDVTERLVTGSIARAEKLKQAVSTITYRHSVSHREPSAPFPNPSGVDDGVLPRIPSTWSWKRLGDIAEVVGGITKDKKKQSDPTIPEVPYLRVANVQRGRLDLSRVSTIRVPESRALELELQPGDVLLNEGGDRDKLGRGWIWEGQIRGAIHQNHVFRARVRDDAIHPKLLSWYANSAVRWFEANGKQSVNLASISLSKIKQLPVPVPPTGEEQDRIVERIEDQTSILDATIDLARRTLAKSHILRRAILNQAFSGRLVAQNPVDEPASVLLVPRRSRSGLGPLVQSLGLVG